jgi:predicted acyltransferase
MPAESISPVRALALDALRGIAILGMILSSRIPATLPNWMFHAQNPPPSEALKLWPGISWVDLVFPFFLFSMGAAFPFALSKKIGAGESKFKISIEIIFRGLLLTAFAIIIAHIRPTSLNPHPNIFTNLIAVCAFVLLFFAYAKLPQVTPKMNKILKAIGFAGLVVFLAIVKYPGGSGFRYTRSDIIILVLANMSVFGSLIWLFTRENILLRVSVFGILLAFRLTQNIDGSWMKYLWDNFQIPGIFRIYFCQYLFIIIPGTIVGDIILKWIKEKKDKISNTENAFSKISLWSIVIILTTYIVLMLSLLISRWVVFAAIFTFIFCIIMLYIFRWAKSIDERLLQKLFNWAAYWLIIGIMFESYEGGIQKAKPTMSFYFITTGMAILVLIIFTVIIDLLKQNKSINLLIHTGQNPMIAYAGGTNLITPLFAITYIDKFLQYFAVTPWLGAVKGLFITLALAYITSFFTKRKIFWRT